MPVKQWKSYRDEVQRIIAKSLQYGGKSWTELWNSVKGEIKSKMTLSLYLKKMIEEGSIVRRAERQGNGARTRYSLIFNSKIRTLLGEPLGDTNIHAVIELNKLNEEEFSELACSSLIVDFLNVLYGYTLITIKRKRRGAEVGTESEMRLLKGLAATLMEKLNIYGEYLVERIEKNSFSLKDLERSRIKILNEQRAKHVSIAEKTRLRNDTTEGITPLKISLGELRYKKDRTIKATDLDLKKIHTLTFEPKKYLAVAKLEKMEKH